MKTRIVGLFVPVAFLTFAAVTRADPVTITSGSLYHNSDFGPDGAQLRLELPGFTLETFVHIAPLPGSFFGAPLQPGETVVYNTATTSFVDELGTSTSGSLQFTASTTVLPSTLLPLPTEVFTTFS